MSDILEDVVVIDPSPLESRPETGPMQFGDDWPGVFIRGDNALFGALMLEQILKYVPEDAWVERSWAASHAGLLRSCSAHRLREA